MSAPITAGIAYGRKIIRRENLASFVVSVSSRRAATSETSICTGMSTIENRMTNQTPFRNEGAMKTQPVLPRRVSIRSLPEAAFLGLPRPATAPGGGVEVSVDPYSAMVLPCCSHRRFWDARPGRADARRGRAKRLLDREALAL